VGAPITISLDELVRFRHPSRRLGQLELRIPLERLQRLTRRLRELEQRHAGPLEEVLRELDARERDERRVRDAAGRGDRGGVRDRPRHPTRAVAAERPDREDARRGREREGDHGGREPRPAGSHGRAARGSVLDLGPQVGNIHPVHVVQPAIDHPSSSPTALASVERARGGPRPPRPWSP